MGGIINHKYFIDNFLLLLLIKINFNVLNNDTRKFNIIQSFYCKSNM